MDAKSKKSVEAGCADTWRSVKKGNPVGRHLEGDSECLFCAGKPEIIGGTSSKSPAGLFGEMTGSVIRVTEGI